MAKKKKRKEEKKASSGYQIELVGLLFILIAIIGICEFGIVGNFIKCFGAFLVGELYNILLASLAVIGLYMMIKREKPDFFTSNLVGLYIIVLAILIFYHINYVKEFNLEGLEIFKETINNLMSFSDGAKIYGGGILGAIFSFAFVKLFSIEGTRVVCIVLMISGFIMFTGMSIYDMVKGLKSKTKKLVKPKESKKDKLEISKVEDEYEQDNKIVVSSVNELIHVEDKKNIDKVSEKPNQEEKVVDEKPGVYIFPSINLLSKPTKNSNKENEVSIKNNVPILETVFRDFGIDGKVVAAHVGPAVTQYEIEIKAGTKVNKIVSLDKEMALALAAKTVKIQAPIPGKKTIGIELPNKSISMVSVREILERVPKSMGDAKLLVTLGRDIMGNPQYCEINKTPHLLVAGSTGSGKSVCINSMIVSILMRSRPDEVKLVLVDPKKVELSMYNGVPHLLTPVVTDPKKANIALKKIVSEMERRYDLFESSGTKNIAGYNMYVEKKNATLEEYEQLKKLPYIVVIIDELADLMLVAAKEVEDSIMRITQMARAAGIHLIVATQRPSTDVITGVVKANIPSRISFAVSSSIDSRTILDMTGAEKLLGKGDMLFLPQGENTPIRIQGTFISDDEIKNVVDYTIKQQKAKYDETFTMDEEDMKGATTMVDSKDDYDEPLYNEIVEFVVTQGKASASLLQRRFRLGYNRAARCIDLLEERGIIGPNNGSKPREVLVKVKSEEEN